MILIRGLLRTNHCLHLDSARKLFHRECAKWLALANMVMNLWVLPTIGTFLSILAERLLASQEGLCFIQLACYLSSPAHIETVCSKLEQRDEASIDVRMKERT
jgi:hypothetical protein